MKVGSSVADSFTEKVEIVWEEVKPLVVDGVGYFSEDHKNGKMVRKDIKHDRDTCSDKMVYDMDDCYL